ncbi:hypothetical protein EUU22_21650 [Ciceribacter ferrooxidans]|uniref:Uncharacterized protein n=1 Tax=Ciceribacter ferrooxidans TaxID=2509717 RepID=A0A4Q2SL02_9HYPH|nr:hypothetical protein EUU22_21650 [Ciceribacter ferrooxidans]
MCFMIGRSLAGMNCRCPVRPKKGGACGFEGAVRQVGAEILDSGAVFLFIARKSATRLRLRAADRDPPRYKEIPEVNTRQRVAPSGAFWFCVLSSMEKRPTFR